MKLNRLYFTFLSVFIGLSATAQMDKNKFDSLIRMVDFEREDSLTQNQLRYLSIFSPSNDSAIYFGEAALTLAEKLSDNQAIADTYLSLSNPIRRKGDLERAMDYVLKALSLYEQIPDDKGAAVCYNVIGVGYINQEHYTLAIEYLWRAVMMDSTSGRTDRLATDYNNLGEAYRLSGKLDSAEIIFEKALQLYYDNDINWGIGYALGNIGLVYAEKGEYAYAETLIDSATSIFTGLGDMYPIAVYQAYTSDIFYERGDIAKALQYAHQSFKIGLGDGLKEQIRDASYKLSQLYQDLGDFKSAFEYQNKYLQYRDSINSAETIRKMADLRTEFEVSQKQTEVDLLNQQKKTQQAIGWGLVSGLSLLGALAVVLYRNNQKKLKINKLLEDQKGQLEEMNDTKDKFFSIISHDLRGPVNSFKGISQIIKMYVNTKRTDQLIEVTKDIDNSVEGLSDLLDNLLNWAVQQQGQVPNVPEKVNLSELTADLLKTFSNMAQAKQIALLSDMSDNIDLWVDRNSTMTILRNLVNNAIKFTKNGGEVSVNANQEGDYAVVRIKDTGVGMPKRKLQELFQLKASKRSWGTEGEKGLGLGLQLVDEFINMNQGSITVESIEGVGTSFIVKLPLFESKPTEKMEKI